MTAAPRWPGVPTTAAHSDTRQDKGDTLMKTSAHPTHISRYLCTAASAPLCALCFVVAAIIGTPSLALADHSAYLGVPPGSTQVYFPSPGFAPPCECPDVTDLDGDGDTTEWRRCADINGYNEYQKGCITIDEVPRPGRKLTAESDSHQLFFPPPGFLPVCRCKDVTDLDGDGRTNEMRNCAVINGYNEFQKGCITIDGRPRPGLGAGDFTLKKR